MTKIFGHRGAKAYYPENTLLSFQKALEMGADGLELDVHYSQEGIMVIFHDFELEGVSNGKGYIFKHSLEELKALEISKNGHTDKIPTLEEVLQLIKAYEATSGREILLNVELKAGSDLYPQIEERAVALCQRYLKKEQVIYSSFDHFAIQRIKAIDKSLLTGVLTTAAMVAPWEYVEKLESDFYHPNCLALPEHLLKATFEKGLKLNPYTVNDLDMAQKFMAAGMYALITDTPDKMLEIRNQLGGNA